MVGLLVLAGGCSERAPQEADAQEYALTRDYYKGPVRVQVSVGAETIKLSDLLLLKLSAQSDPGVEIHFPAVSEQVKDFKVRTVFPPTRKLGENGKLDYEQVFEIEPLKIGACEIPALTVTTAQDETTQEIVTDALTVEVGLSLPPDGEIEIGDIEDVVDAAPSPWRLWGGLAGAVVLAGLIGALMLRPKKAVAVKRVYRPAHEIALAMLRSLADEKLVEQGRVQEFYLKLSGCLRQYIENRFALRAPEQTTEEFLLSIGSSDALQADHKRQLGEFLQHCDLVKFARYEPTVEQINQSLSLAERFVESTRSVEHTVDVTDADGLSQEVA
jgi:hypothetical protein